MVDENELAVLDMGDLRYVGLIMAGTMQRMEIFLSRHFLCGVQCITTNHISVKWIFTLMLIRMETRKPSILTSIMAGTQQVPVIINGLSIQVDFSDGQIYLGSPYLIYADFTIQDSRNGTYRQFMNYISAGVAFDL